MRPTGVLVQAATIASPKTIASRFIGPDNKEPGTRVKRTAMNNALYRLGDPFSVMAMGVSITPDPSFPEPLRVASERWCATARVDRVSPAFAIVRGASWIERLA